MFGLFSLRMLLHVPSFNITSHFFIANLAHNFLVSPHNWCLPHQCRWHTNGLIYYRLFIPFNVPENKVHLNYVPEVETRYKKCSPHLEWAWLLLKFLVEILPKKLFLLVWINIFPYKICPSNWVAFYVCPSCPHFRGKWGTKSSTLDLSNYLVLLD